MRRFRTYVITKKTLVRAGIISGGIAAAVGFIFAAKSFAPPAVPAFSGSTDISEAILDEGMPKEDEPFDLSGFISGILGFDKDKPETIIESSSAIFDEAGRNTQSPEVSEKPEKTEEPAITDPPKPVEYAGDKLPSHDEIIAAHELKINNATNYDVDADALCAEPLEISLDNSGPEVLIMHTHTTECFTGDEMAGESERTTDEAHNMCAVGDVIADTLESYGIQCCHDKTIHDYPTYQGSYTRALDTITSDIEKYPSIKVVLDVHRDAYVYSDGSKLRVAAEINGRETAQVMLVLGTDSMGLYHPYWQKNLSLACKVQSAANIMYPGMMRPIDLRRERFNMHVTTGSLLLEVGSNGNTLDEAMSSGEYIARALAAALLNG
ncbi:MAG: stage II sporulation protein P [Candidatus Ornithomonoglobus sp.]